MAENKNNKYLARKAYGERQIDKWVKWSWANTGRISWRELVKKQNEFNIKIY
jgi:hypothetical protein